MPLINRFKGKIRSKNQDQLKSKYENLFTVICHCSLDSFPTRNFSIENGTDWLQLVRLILAHCLQQNVKSTYSIDDVRPFKCNFRTCIRCGLWHIFTLCVRQISRPPCMHLPHAHMHAFTFFRSLESSPPLALH